jgi:flagellar motor switch protein FliM
VANILSQDEVDALLSSFAEEEEPTAAAEPAAEKTEERRADRKISVYDFRRPNRISKDQLRFLEILHETFVVRFSGVLSGYLRTMVDMVILSVEQLSYGEWVQSLPETTCIFPFSMEPLQGSGAVEMNPALALSVVDRLLGGQGQAVDRARDLTHLEQTILARVMQQKLNVLATVWAEVVNFTPELEGYDKQPNLLKLLPDPETVVLITFELKTQTINGTITVCYPFVALEPALTKAGAGSFHSHTIKPRKIPEGPEWITSGLQQGTVQLRARLGSGVVTVGEFIHLSPGDVIRLGTRVDHPILLEVGGEPKFLARPGLSGRKLAVQIVGHAAREPLASPTTGPDPAGTAEESNPSRQVDEERGELHDRRIA